jgi:hypothetical protein|tara:strand:+ start:88 stop:390 length:303 start_codon:yes stop_codon:yes gene_type:complete
MDNRFNLNEEEKNHIRGLHNINVISEQVRNIPGGRVGLAYNSKLVDSDETFEILEKLLGEAQRLTSFVENRSQGKDNWSNEDLVNIQENINTEINNLLKK